MAKSVLSYEEMVNTYFETKEKFEKIKERFENIKKEFYRASEEEMQNNKVSKFGVSFFNKEYEVVKVQPTKVSFDIGYLERCLSKEQLKAIIKKTYTINDDKFFAYLKEIGADPKIVKSFITTDKSVDKDEVDRLAEIGEIDKNKVLEASTITFGTPSYKVKKING